jgi:hypothetical protein
MTPQEQGRHCAKCDKVVVDFSKMDDYNILSHFDSNDNTCGRFQHWQLEKELVLPTLHNPWTRWIKNAAFGGFLFGGALTARSQTNQELDSIIKTTEVAPADSSNLRSRVISGSVVQPDDSVNRIHSIHFRIDSFDMLLPIDDTTMSFVLPNTITGDSLQLELKSDSSSTLLNLSLINTDTTSFTLVYNAKWEFLKLDLIQWDWTEDSSQIFWNESITTITQVYGGFTNGYSVMEPQNPGINLVAWFDGKPQHDVQTIKLDDVSGLESAEHERNKELKIQQTTKASKDLLIYNKRKSSVWWWLLPIPALLFIAGYYWKKKQLAG